MWKINDKEFSAVIALTPAKRYSYFIKRVAGGEELWGLGSKTGWVLFGDKQGHELLSVWPHPRYAAVCAIGDWADKEPRHIKLSEWLETWIPGLRKDGRLIAVFPTPDGKGVAISPDKLKEDLERELSLYE